MEAHGPQFPDSPCLKYCASVSPATLVLGPRTPVLGSEGTKLTDANEPSVALGTESGSCGSSEEAGEDQPGP